MNVPPASDSTMPFSDMAAFNATLLDQIVEQAPRLLKEGLYLAAIPFGYNIALMTRLRHRDDDKDARLVERLAEYSFITPLTNAPSGMSHVVHPVERELLQKRWIREDPSLYRAAHEQALAYWRESHNAIADPFIPTQNIVYHKLIATPEAGIETLIRAFQEYSTLRRLAAIDRLLVTVEEAAQRLADLNDPIYSRLADTLIYFRARLDQLRGNWVRAKNALDPLIQQQTSVRLQPYVQRAYGLSLIQLGQYVEAMDYLERALRGLRQRKEQNEELGFTMLALGDANVQLALAARGYFADPQPPQSLLDRINKYLPILPVPLMIYLSTRGLNFWHPDSWTAMKSQDWIIARLFGRGAKWYRTADALLEADSQRSVWGHADEKLAWLYLRMGDARQAAPRFQELITDRDSEEFLRASAQLGLAEAYWQLGRVEEAEHLVNEALPLIERYEAIDLVALGEDLLGNIAARKRDMATAIVHFGKSLDFYSRTGDLVNATAMAEKLEQVAAHPDASLHAVATTALERADAVLPVRRYTTRFQHPLLQLFQWGMVAILAFLIFITPMLAVRVQQGSFLQYSIGFETQPPLQAGTGIIPLNAEPSFDASILPNVVPDTALNVVFWLVLILLGVYTLLGIYLIASTRFRSLQAATQGQSLAVSKRGMALGSDEPIPWEAFTHVLQAETTLNGVPIPIASTTVLSDGRQRIPIQGATAFYRSLRTRALQRLAPSVQRQTLNSSVFPSGMAWLYLMCLGLIALLLLASTQPFLSIPLSRDLQPIPYSILDLYPLLYLGLIIPPLWWMVVQPLRVLATLRHHQWIALLVMALMVLLLALRILPFFRTWFLQPDMYGYVAAGVLAGALLVAVVRVWRFALPGMVVPPDVNRDNSIPQNVSSFRLWDGAFALIALVCLLFALWATVGTLVSYHLVQLGDAALLAYDARTQCDGERVLELLDEPNEPMTQKVSCPDDPRLLEAVAHYENALLWQRDNALAVRGLGAAHIQRQQFTLAIEDFTRLIALDPLNGYYYADRAVAAAAWSRFALLQGRDEDAQEYHEEAITDFNRAIAAEPQSAELYLWRGSAFHALNQFDNARADYATAHGLRQNDPHPLINLGWLAFQQGQLFKNEAETTVDPGDIPDLLEAAFTEFDNASAFFRQAIHNNPVPSADLHFALGYAQYELGEALQQRLGALEADVRDAALEAMKNHYQAARNQWEEGVRLAPDSAAGYNLRATIYWRIGTLYPDGRNGDICSDGNASVALRTEKEGLLLQSVADFARAGELDPTDDFNFRTQGQIHFLLRNCPNQDPETELKRSIESYTNALTINPDAIPYLQFRPRITFTLWANAFQNRQERAVEFHPYALTACNDYQRLLALAPDNAGNAPVAQRVLPMTQAQADGEIAIRRYDLGYQTYRCLLTIVPAPANYFNAGLTALAVGDGEQAEAWYVQGMQLAEQERDRAALDAAITNIGNLSQVQPDLPENTPAIFDALVTLRRRLN